MPYEFMRKIVNLDIGKLFRTVVTLVIDALVVLILSALVVGVYKTFQDLKQLIAERTVRGGFETILVDTLTIFVVIEIFGSLIEYVKSERLMITSITDATLVFILREILIAMYSKSISSLSILSFAALILAIGGVRIIFTLYLPGPIGSQKRKGQEATKTS